MVDIERLVGEATSNPEVKKLLKLVESASSGECGLRGFLPTSSPGLTRRSRERLPPRGAIVLL